MLKALFVLMAAPLLAQPGPNVYSLEKEQALGQRVAADVRSRAKPFGDAAVGSYVERIGSGLAAGLGFNYQFEVIAAAQTTEPFGVPGGHVFVPAQALLAAADEAEFAGMLAHAIGHVELRHGTRAATRGAVLAEHGVTARALGEQALLLARRGLAAAGGRGPRG